MTERPVRWLFVGQGVMGAAALGALMRRRTPAAVITAEPSLGTPPVTRAATAYALACHHTDRIGTEPVARWPQLFADADVVVCACWTERLALSALRTVPHGWLNLHPSALPAWRGADPVAWQLLARPRRIGCTVHRMTERHDAGPVVAEAAVPVGPGDDRGTLLRRAGRKLGELGGDALDRLAATGGLSERPQREADATWCPPPGTAPMVDPRMTDAEVVAATARAFSPEPGIAVATLSGAQRFAVTGVGDERTADHEPGSVAPAEGDGVAIACRDRWVRGRAWREGGAVPADPSARADLTRPGAARLPHGRP